MSAVVVEDIAKDLLKGIVSGIGKQIGAKMFDKIFDQSDPSYFTEVYKEIEKIMHQEITENTILEINGQVNGTSNWVKLTYNPRKDSGASKKELYDLLEPKVSDLAINMIALLEEKTFAESALAVFIIAAGIHFSLLQELATVDPDVQDPHESSYIVTIKGYGPEYADHAEKIWGNIEKVRKAQVADVEMKSQLIPFSAIPGVTPTFLQWTSEWGDSFTGKKFQDVTVLISGRWTNGNSSDLENRANDARTSYINSMIDALQKDMNDPPHAADTWKKLVTQPLPVID